MVNSINFMGLNNSIAKTVKKDSSATENKVSNPITTESSAVRPSFQHLQANFLSFTGRPNKYNVDESIAIKYTANFDKTADKIWTKACKAACNADSAQLTELHFMKGWLDTTIEALKDSSAPQTTFSKNDKPEFLSILRNPSTKEAFIKSLEIETNYLEREIENLPKLNSEDDLIKPNMGILKAFKAANDSVEAKTYNATSQIRINDAEILEKIDPSITQNIFFKLADALGKAQEATSKANAQDGAIVSVSELMNKNPLGAKRPVAVLTQDYPYDLVGVEHFENKAKTIGTIISGGTNAIYTHDKGAMPQLLAHSFTKLLNNGEFKDLSSENTEVTYLDSTLMLKSGQSAIDAIEKAAEAAAKNDRLNQVVFVEDFDNCISELQAKAQRSAKFEASVYFNKLPQNMHIIGLMKQPMYNAVTDTESPYNKQLPILRTAQTIMDGFEKFGLGSPSPEKVKEALKNEPRLLATITSRHPGLTIATDAIDKAVDLSAMTRKGETLGKSIDLLNFVIGAKTNAKGHVKSITVADIEKFSKEYPELRQSPTSGSGKFSLVHDTGITMKDVGGAAQAKDVVDEVLTFIKTPEKFQKTGAKIPKGILLHGTPGNGKTHLAKAIAGEANAPFISVSGSEFVEKYVGVGAARVRELFEFASEQARSSENKTAIIFIDEFDSLGRARGTDSGGGGREAEQTLNQLLVEMDGLNKHSDVNIVILAATNRPDLLDTAITERPGRFDHKIEVPNPANDPQARFEILNVHARSKKIEGDRKEVLREVADRTSGASGARLADIINKAAIIAAKDDRDALSINDFVEAKLESTAGRIHKDNKPLWYKELVVSHECGHALVKQTLLNMVNESKPWQKSSEIDLITTDSRGDFGGAVFNKPGDNHANTFESMFAEISCCFGGYSVEKSLFEMNGSSGISSDLQQATSMAKTAVSRFGMGPNTGMISVAEDPSVASMMSNEIKEDIKLIVNSAAKVSDKIIAFHKEFIEDYRDEYKANAGKGGNNLSGSEFQTKLAAWIEKNGKQDEYNALQAEIKEIIELTQKGETKKKNRIGF